MLLCHLHRLRQSSGQGLTRVCPFVCLQGLLSGEDSVADVAADAAGGVLTFTDELADGVGSRTATTDPILKQDRR